jgi:hypothetical protein
MAVSLYDLSVASYLQTVGGVTKVLERGRAHCEATGGDPEKLVETRLHPDMLPLHFQIQSVAHHSLGAIQGVRRGEFAPPQPMAPLDYAGLQAFMAETQAGLQSLSSEEVNALQGGEMVFLFGRHRLPFTAENFLLSFSLPNFYFHATTTYDILRAEGVTLRKQDYLGRLRMKT